MNLLISAQSEYNKSGLIQGHIDSKLTPYGIKQAKSIGYYLRNVKFSHAYSSDLARAYLTADEIISQNEKKIESKMTHDELLRERSFGSFQGKKKHLYLEARKNPENAEFAALLKNVETNKQLHTRWKIFLNKTCNDIVKKNTCKSIRKQYES